jgi:hypothetical protein
MLQEKLKGGPSRKRGVALLNSSRNVAGELCYTLVAASVPDVLTVMAHTTFVLSRM